MAVTARQLQILVEHLPGSQAFIAGGPGRAIRTLLARGLLSFTKHKLKTRLTRRGRRWLEGEARRAMLRRLVVAAADLHR